MSQTPEDGRSDLPRRRRTCACQCGCDHAVREAGTTCYECRQGAHLRRSSLGRTTDPAPYDWR